MNIYYKVFHIYHNYQNQISLKGVIMYLFQLFLENLICKFLAVSSSLQKKKGNFFVLPVVMKHSYIIYLECNLKLYNSFC